MCAILLYFLCLVDDRSAEFLAFTVDDWRKCRERADEYESEVFGTYGFRQNQLFLSEHRHALIAWSSEAAAWWCPGGEGHADRSHLLDAFARLQSTLDVAFQVDIAAVCPVHSTLLVFTEFRSLSS